VLGRWCPIDGSAHHVAFVTGGGSGIGRQVCVRLAGEGVGVAVVDLNVDAAEDTARRLRADGAHAIAVKADVTVAEQVRAAVASTLEEFGRLDRLVNCAGIALGEGGVVDCDESAWDTMMAVNVKSIFLTGKYSIPHIIASGGGSVVNIASVFGFRVNKDECAYAASKGAVINLTRQMALQHAGDGIRVNAICPSDCDTPMIAKLLGVTGDALETAKAELAEPIPMGRLADPDDVAAGVAFLLSDNARFITGVALPIDGGFLVK
jgi:NAD(P)-dependent dehydrogenase (short-subunit alcohol dehydrogenase family)